MTLDPTRGHEQRGRRSVLVISPEAYNRKKIGIALVCPTTSKPKGYPFEVPVDVDGTRAAVLCDHLRSVDWKVRNLEKVEAALPTVTASVQENVRKLILEDG